jgi:hypothetical protein
MRRHNVMRNFSKTLTGIFLLFALIVQSEPVSAGNVYIRAGAEGVGQDAWLELNDADQFSLGLVGCKKSRDKLDLQLVLSVYGKGQVPSELEALRSTEFDTTRGLDFCINGICEDNEFHSEAREWGNVLLKDITIDRNQEKIRSMRVIVPDESMKYEYQGDVDGILKKSAKRRQARTSEGAPPLPTFRGFFAISFDNGQSRA